MKKIKSENILLVAFFLVYVIGGYGIGCSIITYFGDDLPGWVVLLRIIEGILLVCLAIFLQIILHEMGHMIAAILRGWKFVSFMALGWVLSRKNGKFQLTRFSIVGAAGQCLMLPPPEGDTDRGIAFYNAGGVLMNVTVSLLAICVLVLGHTFLPWDIAVFLALFAFVGFCFTLVNGIPAVMNGLPNDGKNIQQLCKDRFSTEVFLATMRLMGRMQQGETIDQVASGYLCEGQQLDYANPIHLSALSFDVSLAIDRLDFDKAHALLAMIDGHEAEMADIFRKELMFEKVYLYIVSPRDDKEVKDLVNEDFLKYMNAQCAFRPIALRVKYAYTLLHERNVHDAEQLRLQFEHACNKYHILGEVTTERKLVAYAASLGCSSVGKTSPEASPVADGLGRE